MATFLHRIWFFLLVAILPGMASASSPSASYSYPIFSFSEDETPNIGDVLGMMQDSRGIIWFWGNEGVSFYDGIQFEKLTVRDGLPDNYVYKVVEYSPTKMYFCTFRGLRLYDFTTGNLSEPIPLQDRTIRDIIRVDDVTLLATNAGVLASYKEHTHYIAFYDSTRQEHMETMAHALARNPSENVVWAATERHGLFRIDVDSLKCLLDINESVEKHELCPHYDSLVFKPYHFPHPDDCRPIALSAYRISESERRLELWNSAVKNIPTEFMATGLKEFRDLAISENGTIYAWNHHVIYQLVDGNMKISPMAKRLGTTVLNQIILLPGNKLFLLTESGVFQQQDEEWNLLDHSRGLPSNVILTGMIDHSGTLWLVDGNGLISRLTTTLLDVYSENDFPALHNISNSIALPDGGLIFSGELGITLFQDGKLRVISEALSNEQLVRAFALDRNNNVLISTINRLYLLTIADGKMRPLTPVLPPHPGRFYISTAPDGSLVTALSGKLYRWDGKILRVLAEESVWFSYPLTILATEDNSVFISGWVYTVRIKDGHFWVYGDAERRFGTMDKFSRHTLREDYLAATWLPYDMHLREPAAVCSEIGPDGAYWFGTFAAGLMRIATDSSEIANGDSVQVFDHRDGLPDDNVQSAFRHPNGDLYFIFDTGIVKITKDSLEVLRDPTPEDATTFQLYQDETGNSFYATSHGLFITCDSLQILLNRYFGLPETRINEMVVMQDERLAVVQPNGFFIFNTNKLISSLLPGDMPFVASIYSDSTRIPVSEFVSLPLGKRRIEINLGFPDFLNPGRNRYSWRLSGLDDHFRIPTHRNHVFYTNLTPGKHEFQVNAWNGLGQKRVMLTPIILVVPAYFYETSAFFIFVGIVVVFFVLLFIRWRITQARKKQQRELEIEMARLKTAHQLAATIAHEFNNPLAIIKGASDLYNMPQASEDVRERMIQRIPAQVERMKNLVNTLLKLREIKEINYVEGIRILDLNVFLDSAGNPVSAQTEQTFNQHTDTT